LDECNAVREVAKSKIPILFIHGDADSFVPCEMVYKLHDACNTEKKLVIIKGAGHVEACYKDSQLYESSVASFVFPYVTNED
jgi:fermentation-respiration switch protein FrsA (DUF1100 family)